MKKLSLKTLKVNSFVTNLEVQGNANTVKGGQGEGSNTFNPCITVGYVVCARPTKNACTLDVNVCGA